MNNKTTGAWLTLSRTYHTAPVGNRRTFLDDANMRLKRAKAIASSCVNSSAPTELQQTMVDVRLEVVETLMEMSAGCVRVAQSAFRGTWRFEACFDLPSRKIGPTFQPSPRSSKLSTSMCSPRVPRRGEGTNAKSASFM
jgi:hypothetical protein